MLEMIFVDPVIPICYAHLLILFFCCCSYLVSKMDRLTKVMNCLRGKRGESATTSARRQWEAKTNAEQEDRHAHHEHVPKSLEVEEPQQKEDKGEQKGDVEMHKAQLEPEKEVLKHRRKPFATYLRVNMSLMYFHEAR
jgi:hypothetical protein